MMARLPVAIFFWAWTVPFIYEGFAYLTGIDPTISKITSGTIELHPHLSVVGAFFIGAAFLLLLLHFTNLLPWWRP